MLKLEQGAADGIGSPAGSQTVASISMRLGSQCHGYAWGLAISLLSLTQFGCSHSAQAYLDKGNRFFAVGKFEDATLQYRNSINKNPNSGEAHYQLSLAELKLGHSTIAYRELRRAVELSPSREEYRVQLADLGLDAYDANPGSKILYEQIKETSEYLLQKDRNSFDGWRLRGDVLSIDGKMDEAIAAFRKANSVKAYQPNVVLPMLQVLLRLNEVPEAEDLARQFFLIHKDFGPAYDVLLNYYLRIKRTPEAEALLKSKVTSMPNDATPIIQLARLYVQLHREPEAARVLQRLLDDPKRFPEGHSTVGDFYASNERFDEALREYKLGLQLSNTEKLTYRKKIAKILGMQGKREEAIEQLSQVIKENPEDSDSRLARAILLRDSNDPKKLDQAINEMNLLLQKVPNDEIAHYNLGVAYMAKGDLNSAKRQLAESASLQPSYAVPRKTLAEIAQRERNYSETIRLANEILQVNPSDFEARLLHAGALLGSKSYRQARTELEALLRESPNSVDVNLHLAVLDTQEGRYREAETRYRQLYKAGDNDLRPLEGLIQLYIAEKQPAKALALLEQELKQNPDSKPVHLLSATVATVARKLDFAMQQYQWLQANDPNSVEVYKSLGSFYQLRGDLVSALASYQRARDLAPNDPKVLGMIAFLQDASGKQVDAIANLQKQLTMNPRDTIAMNNLAFILADTSTDLDRALTLAQAAERQVPNNPGFEDTLGWVYVKKGLNDSAIQIFNRLVDKYPEEPSFRFHLGVALLQKGETAEAKSEFLISLSHNPSKDIADKIKQILSKLS